MTTATQVAPQPLARTALGTTELSDAARELLVPDIKLAQYIAQLARRELWTDALRAAAGGLPREKAVWWATLCLWQHYRPAPPPAADACLRAVASWLSEPTDDHRRAAYAAGQAAGFTTPAGNLALAVFLSEGSISLPGQPPVAAQPQHLPKSLAAAVTLAVQQTSRAQSSARATDYIRLALEVLAGRWPVPN